MQWCKKANRMLGLIKRSIVHKDQHNLVALYKSLVRPHLECCCSAWSPRYVKDKEFLEKVQHRFTRLFKDFRDLDYISRLDHLGLWALEERRNRADLIEVFKLCKGHTLLPLDLSFSLILTDEWEDIHWKFVNLVVTKISGNISSLSWNSLSEDVSKHV